MNWKRLGLLIILGLLSGIVFAYAHAAMQAPPPTTTSKAPTEITTTEVAAPTEALAVTAPSIELPAATQALLASLNQAPFQPERGDLRLVAISDLNGAYGSTDYDPDVDKAIALIPFWQPDLVVAGGDMIAGQSSSLTTAQIQAMWAAFDEHVRAPLDAAGIPFGFTIGNHDASGARGANGQFTFQQERDLATAYWQAPEHTPDVEFIDRADYPFFYTFRQGDVFFMAWDGSTHQIPPDKLTWVEQSLASEAAQSARLRILLSHLPLYAVAEGRNAPGEVMANAEQLRTMLERYNVHTYISGHHHAYYPGHRGKLQLLHMGIIGSGPRALIDSDLPRWKAITVLDIDFEQAESELIRYTTYDIQTLELIEYGQLPRYLAGHNGMVLRRDLELADLSTAEQSACQAKLGTALCS
ncbi:metallophosphoesterase family protein [Leptolyngbya iicbica]|uniref:Metallophosphoesterase n=2 Tax=Cyanophyceae TaxID=3028117 RepID=A0A4Q7E790_9CYAN|nr:metallophosphoesterase [Leptolyngbya sp. LK]RZM76485.1 metallophosphoesterase [Leptolyngbya sp. LK]